MLTTTQSIIGQFQFGFEFQKCFRSRPSKVVCEQPARTSSPPYLFRKRLYTRSRKAKCASLIMRRFLCSGTLVRCSVFEPIGSRSKSDCISAAPWLYVLIPYTMVRWRNSSHGASERETAEQLFIGNFPQKWPLENGIRQLIFAVLTTGWKCTA